MSTQLSTGSVQAPPDAPSPEGAAGAELPLDVVFDLLSNERRRRVLRYLEADPETTLGDLAEHIAALENDKPERELSSTERKRVYICLYQCHLPRMDDAGVIDFDEHRKTVEAGENVEAVTRYLPAQKDSEAGAAGGGWATAVADVAQAFDRRLRTWTSA